MPVSRPDATGRDLPPDGVAVISRALECFVLATAVPVKQIAAAIDLNPADLSPSHLRKRGTLLLWRLRREELPRIAVKLQLDLAGYRSLQRLSTALLEILAGFPIPEQSWLGSSLEAADAGTIGVELFDRHDWVGAASHLEYAWPSLSVLGQNPQAPQYRTAVRVGTQLVSQFNHEGSTREAMRVARALLKIAGAYRGQEKGILNAVGLAYRSIGVAAHHQGLDTPAAVIRLLEKAHGMLNENSLNQIGQVGALRDQAKPYIQWSLGDTSQPPDPGRSEVGLAILDQADRLVGGEEPEEAARAEWMMTRLTRVECLGVLGRAKEARHYWENLWEREWSEPWLTEPGGVVAAKASIAEMAISLASAEPDALLETAKRFRENPANAPYGDRLRRVAVIERAAIAGEVATAQRAILGRAPT